MDKPLNTFGLSETPLFEEMCDTEDQAEIEDFGEYYPELTQLHHSLLETEDE